MPGRRRPRERQPGQWRQTRQGESLCSHPPEDLVVAGFGGFVEQKAKNLLSGQNRRVQPFVASLLDGVDVRETIRHWEKVLSGRWRPSPPTWPGSGAGRSEIAMNLSTTACNLIVLILALLILLAGVAYCFINRLLRKVKEAQQKLIALATIDDLTQLYNRRYFFVRFQQELERAKRYQRPLSCLILDLDHFKQVNDTYGHLAGDQVLKEIAHILKTQCRQSDLAGRYGGEEMIVLLPETDAHGAFAIAERIREMIQNHETVSAKGQSIRVTVSIGVAHLNGAEVGAVDNPDRIVQYADDALLAAKKKGRNRIKLYQST